MKKLFLISLIFLLTAWTHGVGTQVVSLTDLGNHARFANSQTNTMTVAAAAGSTKLVPVFIFDSNTSVTSATVTDSKSNTYTLAASIQVTGGNGWILLFYSFLTTPLTTSDTIVYTGAAGFTSSNMTISASLVNGTFTTLDGATTATATSFSGNFSVAGAGSASVANEINFGLTTNAAGNANTITSAGWNTTPPSSPSAGFTPAWQVNTGTSALTFAGTLSSTAWAALIVSFK
jgi:hypothetical protein